MVYGNGAYTYAPEHTQIACEERRLEAFIPDVQWPHGFRGDVVRVSECVPVVLRPVEGSRVLP